MSEPASPEPATPTSAQAPSRTCAVCHAAIDDPAALRCPNCHSRYLRASPTATPGPAAGDPANSPAPSTRVPGISVLPSAPGPPRREDHLLYPAASLTIPGAAIALGGFAICCTVFSLASINAELAVALGVVGLSIFIYGLVRTVKGPYATTIAEPCCNHCGFPIPESNHGRCPECGELLRPLPASERFCPQCRRGLRGLRGDTCPDCHADIRAICEPEPRPD